MRRPSQRSPAGHELPAHSDGKAARKKRLPLTVSDKVLLSGGTDRDFRRLLHDMLAFASAIQEVRHRLGQLIGLSGTQYTILMAIARLSEDVDDLGINHLADHLHLSGAFVTIEVNKLVTAGLVDKRPNSEDRRRVILTITDAACQLVTNLACVQSPANDALFSGLSVADFQTLLTLMSRLARNGGPAIHLIKYLSPDGRPVGSRTLPAKRGTAGM